MKIEKTKNASRNILFGVALKVYQLMLPFVMRTILMYTIGVEYLGLNSLFTSVLQVLNLAELGVGSAMVFSMYRPIAEDDTITICALMRLYKLYYRMIGAIILGVGLILTPLIPKLISGALPDNINIYILYLFNLFSTVLTYWLFAYRNSVLQAHQRNDLISKVSLGTETVKYLFQALALILMRNYYYFIIIALATQILNNIITAVVSHKLFPQYNPKGSLPKSDVKKINGKIKDLFTSKLGYTIVSSADTIVISSFLGLTVLAQYQNYYYIMSSIIGLMSIIYSSIIAGIGNSILTKTKDQNYIEFKIFTLLVSLISGICIACFLTLYQPFMAIWMGEDMLLPFPIIILLCFYFWFYELVMMISAYKDAAGIWHQDRFRPLIAGGANFIVNLALVQFIGLYGIVLSTILSQLFISLPWIIHNVHKFLFQRSSKEYFFITLKNSVKILCSSAIVYILVSLVDINGILGLILKGILTICLATMLMILLSCKDKQFKDAMEFLFRLLKLEKLHKKVRQ